MITKLQSWREVSKSIVDLWSKNSGTKYAMLTGVVKFS